MLVMPNKDKSMGVELVVETDNGEGLGVEVAKVTLYNMMASFSISNVITTSY